MSRVVEALARVGKWHMEDFLAAFPPRYDLSGHLGKAAGKGRG